MRSNLARLAAAVCLAWGAGAQPAPDAAGAGGLLDPANVLSADAAEHVRADLAKILEMHGVQIGVLVMAGDPGPDRRGFPASAMAEWGVGGDRSVLLVYSPPTRNLLIHAGTSLLDVLDDQAQGWVINEVTPALSQNDADTTIVEAVHALARVLDGTAGAQAAEGAADVPEAGEASDEAVESVAETPVANAGPPAAERAPEDPRIEAMWEDAERIASSLDADPLGAIRAVLAEAGGQLPQVPAILAQRAEELSAAGEAALAEGRLVMFVILLVLAGISAIALLTRSFIAFAFVFGFFGTPLFAAVTGFVALSLCLLAAALLTPVLARILPPVLRAVLSRDHDASDERWQPRPQQVVPANLQLQRPGPPAPAFPDTRNPPRPPWATEGPRVRAWYWVVVAVLFITAFPLGVLALAGIPAWKFYHQLRADPTLRRKLLELPVVVQHLKQLQRTNPKLYQKVLRMQQAMERDGRRRGPASRSP